MAKISFKKKEGGSMLGNLIRTAGPSAGAMMGIPPGITSKILGKGGKSAGGFETVPNPIPPPPSAGSVGTFAFFCTGMLSGTYAPYIQAGVALMLIPTWFAFLKSFLKK